jgi:hypothetical protein
MNAETIQTGIQILVMVLSFVLLLRVRRLSLGLWSTEPSCQPLPVGSDGGQPSESDQIL